MRVRRSSPNGGAGNWLVRVLSSSTSRITTAFIFLTAIILFVRQYSENDTSALLVLLSNKYLEESKDEGQSKRLRADTSDESAASVQDPSVPAAPPNTSGPIEIADVVQTETKAIPLHDGLLRSYPPRGYGAPDYWSDMLQEGENLNKELRDQDEATYLDIIEVGANDAKQAREIASRGFNAHSFEPSPKSYIKMTTQLSKDNVPGIFLYNVAVGNSDGATVNFLDSDSTGASVVVNGENEPTVEVKMVTIDHFLRGNISPDFGGDFPVIENSTKHMLAAKIDVQGFEPQVFSGMKETIQKRKIHYIMTEFWPKGIDKMNNYTSNKCEESFSFLSNLHNAGYIIFAAPIEAHPRSDPEGREQTAANKLNRRFDDLKEDCLDLHRLEQKYPSKTDWSMGYWTDIFAVSPDAPLPSLPTTRFGKAIQAMLNTPSLPKPKK